MIFEFKLTTGSNQVFDLSERVLENSDIIINDLQDRPLNANRIKNSDLVLELNNKDSFIDENFIRHEIPLKIEVFAISTEVDPQFGLMRAGENSRVVEKLKIWYGFCRAEHVQIIQDKSTVKITFLDPKSIIDIDGKSFQEIIRTNEQYFKTIQS